VFDSRVAYQLQEWTHARSGCGSKSGWPPLWSCMYAYPSEAEARHAVFPRGSQQQKGARVGEGTDSPVTEGTVLPGRGACSARTGLQQAPADASWQQPTTVITLL
jgi:predicted amidohydrolase YtcJ